MIRTELAHLPADMKRKIGVRAVVLKLVLLVFSTAAAAAAAKSLRRNEIENTDKHVEPWERYFTAGGSAKWCIHFGS